MRGPTGKACLRDFLFASLASSRDKVERGAPAAPRNIAERN
jgi:hypothetical protein